MTKSVTGILQQNKYRQILEKRLYEEEINTPISEKLWLEATGKLQCEIYSALLEKKPDILFLNRNIITNHFMHKQGESNISLQETLSRIKNSTGGVPAILPDITFILHTGDIGLFLKRAKNTLDNGFRTKILKKYFHLYDEVLYDLDQIRFPYILIDANQTIEEINIEITDRINRLIEPIGLSQSTPQTADEVSLISM